MNLGIVWASHHIKHIEQTSSIKHLYHLLYLMKSYLLNTLYFYSEQPFSGCDDSGEVTLVTFSAMGFTRSSQTPQ